MDDGGRELDMVVNLSRVLSGDWDYVRRDLGAVIDLAHQRGGRVKVIFENCFLKDDQKIRLCGICGEVRADFVKTSTGYGTGGATLEDLRLMRKHAPPHVQVKAAGGVRTLDALLAVMALGVTRIGATATATIIDDFRARKAGAVPTPVAGSEKTLIEAFQEAESAAVATAPPPRAGAPASRS